MPTLFIGNMNCMVRKSKPIGLLGPHSQRVKGQERGTRESKRREQTKQSTKQAGQLCRIALLWGTHQPQQQNQQQTKTAAQTNRHTHTWRQAYRSCCLTLKPVVSACLSEIERGRGERMWNRDRVEVQNINLLTLYMTQFLRQLDDLDTLSPCRMPINRPDVHVPWRGPRR